MKLYQTGNLLIHTQRLRLTKNENKNKHSWNNAESAQGETSVDLNTIPIFATKQNPLQNPESSHS